MDIKLNALLYKSVQQGMTEGECMMLHVGRRKSIRRLISLKFNKPFSYFVSLFFGLPEAKTDPVFKFIFIKIKPFARFTYWHFLSDLSQKENLADEIIVQFFYIQIGQLIFPFYKTLHM
jgi:hypothetical protein